ncbi:hypothetical protein L7F22_057789 [Adiantum nelumboides]|nr:hypothetical protein [Adiantum nelumboides]
MGAHLTEGMGAHLTEGPVEHEPLLLHVSDTGVESHSQARPLLKAIINAIAIFCVILALILAFNGLIRHENEGQDSQNRRNFLIEYLDERIRFLPDYGSETNIPNWACLCEVVYNHLTTLHDQINELALTHANVHRFTNYLAELVKPYNLPTLSFKQHQLVHRNLAPKNVEMPSSGTHISLPHSAVSKRLSRGGKKSYHTLLKAKMVSFIKIVHELAGEGLLQSHHRILCLDTSSNVLMQALKKRGFNNAVHLTVSAAPMVANHEVQNALEDLEDQSFDFAFTTIFDQVLKPAHFVAEIERVLKVGGYAAMHVSLNAWRNKYIRGKPGDDVKPVTLLFKTSKIVYVSAAYSPGLDTIIVFKKVSHNGLIRHSQETKGVNQTEKDEKEVSDHQPVVDSSGSFVKYDCRKCIKERDVMFAPTAIQ